MDELMRLSLKLISAAAAAAAASGAVGAQPDPSFVPAFRQNFPDAFVLQNGSEFLAYSTNAGPNVPMARSTDLVHWSFVTDPATGKERDALPQLGAWAKPGFTWAPEVIGVGDHWLL